MESPDPRLRIPQLNQIHIDDDDDDDDTDEKTVDFDHHPIGLNPGSHGVVQSLSPKYTTGMYMTQRLLYGAFHNKAFPFKIEELTMTQNYILPLTRLFCFLYTLYPSYTPSCLPFSSHLPFLRITVGEMTGGFMGSMGGSIESLVGVVGLMQSVVNSTSSSSSGGALLKGAYGGIITSLADTVTGFGQEGPEVFSTQTNSLGQSASSPMDVDMLDGTGGNQTSGWVTLIFLLLLLHCNFTHSRTSFDPPTFLPSPPSNMTLHSSFLHTLEHR